MLRVAQADHSITGIEEENNIAGELPNLVAVPHKRFRRSAWSTASEGFDVFRLDRIVKVLQELLLLRACPRLQGNLPVWRIADAARRTLSRCSLPATTISTAARVRS